MTLTMPSTLSSRAEARDSSQDIAGPSGIQLDRVSVSYRGTEVLKPLTLTIAPGEVLALIGPSGSGKTTVLRAIAGFVQPSAGRIAIGDVDVTDVPPYERGLGMVVQNYALFPHMRVEDNVAFGLRAQCKPRGLTAERVEEALAIVGMSAYAKRYPSQLSGGQQQRVAIARAIAVRPKVLLLDEPLSALDAQVRQELRAEIRALQQRLGITTLMVTHDQDEALAMSDRVVLLARGQIAQQGAPRELYEQPASALVAGFIGRMNWMEGQVVADGRVRVGTTLVDCDTRVYKTGSVVRLGIRPEAVQLLDGAGAMLRARVDALQFQGAVTQVLLRSDALGGALSVELSSAEAAGLREGEVRGLRLAAAAIQLFDAPLSMRRVA